MRKISRAIPAIIFVSTIIFLMLMVLPAATSIFASDRSEGTESYWKTHFEKSGGRETPRYEETIAYSMKLAAASPWIEFSSFGKSPQGRILLLLIADRDKNFSPERARRAGRVVFLVQACIHAGESDGKDAGLMLLRDIAISKKYPDLLDNITLLFIPIFNVDGHERFGPNNRVNQNGPEEMGWRVTAQNLNLNRDYLKTDTPEMKAWLGLFAAWLPDFFADCHVTDGADFQYAITYVLEIRGNMAPGLTEWTRANYLKPLEKMMTRRSFPLSPYVHFRERHDPRSGLVSWVAPPRFSQGYTAIQNRPGLLIETHMLKDYKTRVTATYEMLKSTLELLNREQKSLLKVIREADALTASRTFRERPFPVRFRPAPDSVIIDFIGVEYEKGKSDLTGGNWFKWGKKPVTYKIPFFYKYEPEVFIKLPEAYIIPPEWSDVIERLELHGIRFKRLTTPVEITVSSYKFTNTRWQRSPYEGRFPLEYAVESIEETRSFPAGSAVVSMNQRTARVAAHILEPQAPDALAHWGFFNTIFEQKEYPEDYVMEEMARDMLAADPKLKKEFEDKMSTDEDFAKSPRAILNWFYQRTPYWDDRINIYPVGKIMDRGVLDHLPISG